MKENIFGVAGFLILLFCFFLSKVQSIKNRGKGKDDEEEVIRDGDTAMRVISSKTSQDEDVESWSRSEGEDYRPTASCRDENEKNNEEDYVIAKPGVGDTSRPGKNESHHVGSDSVPSDQSYQLAQQLQAFAATGEQDVRSEQEMTNRFDAEPNGTDIDEFGMSKSFDKSGDVSREDQLVRNEFSNNSMTGLLDFHQETLHPSWSLDQTVGPSTKQTEQTESEDWTMIHPPSEGSLNVVVNPWDQMNADESIFKPQDKLLHVSSDHSVHDDNLVVTDVTAASHDDVGLNPAIQVKSGFDDDFLPTRETTKDVDSARSSFPDVIEGFGDAFATDC